ncbi:MAG: hypothetical protein ACKOQ1_09895, partial [Actinomycetota bacterium]
MSAHLGVVADLGFYPEIIWIVACVAVAAFAQSLSGFGFALIAVPLMTVVLEPRVAVVVATMVGAV